METDKTAEGVFAQDVLDYIEQHYVTIDQLADATSVPAARIDALIGAECVPPHAYEIAGEVTLSSAFGTYRQPMRPTRVYPKSLADWIRRAAPLADDLGLEAAAQQIRKEFMDPIKEALPTRWPDGPEGAWRLLRDGSWGLCLKEISPQNAISKERARVQVAEMQSSDAPADQEALRAAVADYDRVALPFAPHERPESSSKREIDPIRELL